MNEYGVKKISLGRMIAMLTLLCIVIVGGTFAWFTYSSRQSALVLTIGEINDTQIKLSPYQIKETITPGNTYTSGVYSEVEVVNGGERTTSVVLYYKINQLDANLIDKGLAYTIVDSSTGKNVKSGYFSDLIDTSKTLPDEVVILDESTSLGKTSNYKVYLWLDSSKAEQSELQNSSLDMELNGSIGSVSISGVNTYGQKLTANVVDTNTTATYTYQWYSNTTNSTTGGTAISGATGKEYTIGAGLVGKYIYVVANAVEDYYDDRIYTDVTDVENNTTSTVDRKAATLIVNPKTLNLTYPIADSTTISYTYDGDGTVTCNSADSNIATCTVNTSTKKVTVTPKSAAFSTTISLSATQGANYKATTSANVTVSVAKGTMTAGTVTISGTNTYGNTLTATVGTDTNPKADSYTYQWWYATSANATSGSNISGATSSTYKIGDNLVGKYIGVTVTGNKNYYNDVTFSDITDTVVAPKSVSGLTVTLGTSEYIYDGTAKTPTVTVKDGSTTLTKGTHYSVSYSSNINVGTATVTITGINAYTGTLTKTFTIVKLIPEITISPTSGTVNYNSTATFTTTVKTSVNVAGKLTAESSATGYVAITGGASNDITATKNGVAKTITYKGVTATTTARTITVTFTPTDTNNVETVSKTFSVTAVNKVNLTITAKDQTITYGSSIATGTGQITYGTLASANDTVTSVTLTPSTSSVTSNGTITPSGAVIKNGTTDVTNNYNIVYVAGKLVINPKNASTLTITLSPTSYTYDGTAKTPTVTVKDGSTTLTSGTHYTVAYSNNTNAGTATVTVTGKGNYTGTKTATFTINKKNCECEISSSTAPEYPKTTVVGSISYSCSGDGSITVSSASSNVITVNNIQSTSATLTAKSLGSSVITVGRKAGANYNACTNDTETVTVKASTYKVTADSQSGSIASTTGWTGTGGSATKDGTYGSAYETLPTISRNGYTFNGWSLIPDAYQQVEYIQATGTQYIETNVVGTARWEFDIQFTNLTTRQLMGYGGSGSEYWGVQTDGNYGLATWSYMNYKAGNRDKVIHNYGEGGLYYLDVNGTRMNPGITDVSSKSYKFFALENNAYNASAKLYRVKTVQNGSLIRDFIPCYRKSDGVIGLYDRLNGVFYTNSGSGTFSKGSDVYITSSSIISTHGNHKIYANWNSITYTVKYNCGNGTGTPPANQTIGWGNTITVNGNGGSCSLKGHSFSNWSDPTGDTSWTGWTGTWSYANGSYGITDNVLTLKANYTPKTYTVKYNCGSGASGTAPSNQTVVYGNSITINGDGGSCSKTGYTFKEWSDPTGDTSWTGWTGTWSYAGTQYGIVNDSELTLTAQWTKSSVNVTYDSGNLFYGLRDIGVTTSGRMKYGISDGVVTVTALNDDGYGYTDGRVYLEANNTYKFSANCSAAWGSVCEAFLMLDGSTNTAYYHMGSTTTTFTPTVSGTYWLRLDVNTNGTTATFSNISISRISTVSIGYDENYTLPSTPTRTGYTFKGWYTASSGGTKVTTSTKVTNASSHTLYGQWTNNTYDLYLMGQGGVITNGKTLTNLVTNGSFENSSTGWSLSNASIVSSKKYTGNYSLQLNSGTTAMSNQTMSTSTPTVNHKYYGRTMFLSSTSFSGSDSRFEWYNGDHGDGISQLVFASKSDATSSWITKSSVKKLTSSSYLGNSWYIRNFMVNGNVNTYVDDIMILDLTNTYGSGGELVNTSVLDKIAWFDGTQSIYSKSIINGSNYGTLPIPTRDGYTFSGWYTQQNCSGTKITDSSSVNVTSSQVLYACWVDSTPPTISSVSASTTYDVRNYIDFTATDSISGIVGYNVTTSTTAPTTWIPVISAVENATETKYAYSAAWARIFHHNTHRGTVLYSNANEAKSSNTVDKYSVLANTGNYVNSSGVYEMLLEYPGESGYNRWKQTSNPAATSESVSGYTAVNVSWTDNYWNGLALSNSGLTFIDGSINHSNWYYAIGSYTRWSGAIPGASSAISHVNLWIRIDDKSTTAIKTALTRRIGDISSNGTYYVWVKDALGNVTYKSVSVSKVDTTAPSATITASGGANATLGYSDSGGVTKYYWGTADPISSDVSWTSISSTTSGSVTGSVSAAGTYYLGVQDAAGNVSKASKAAYSIAYNACSGSGAPGTQYKVAGGTATLSSTKPTRTNYTFKGWSTASCSGSVTHASGASYTTDANTTLYAIWEYSAAPSVPTYTAFYADGSGTYTSGTWTNKLVHTTLTTTSAGTGIYMQYRENGTSTWKEFSFSAGALSQNGTTWTGTEPWGLRTRNQTYFFRACDSGGRCSGESIAFNIRYDLDAPSTPTLTTIYNLWNSRSYTFRNFSSDAGKTGTWTTSTGDASFGYSGITDISGINGGYIKLASALSADMAVQIFYATSSGSFSEANSNTATLTAGQTEIYIPFTNTGTWTQFRFDMGNNANVSFKISNLGVSATANQWNRDNIIIGSTSSDNAGISNWQYTYDTSAGWNNLGGSGKTTIYDAYSSERNQNTYIRACDALGNCSSAASTKIMIDKTTPTVANVVSASNLFPQKAPNSTNTMTISGNNLTTSGTDPFIVFSGLNATNVSRVIISLGTAISKVFTLQIFYATSGTSFSEANSVKVENVPVGTTTIEAVLPGGTYTALRFDFGGESGVTFNVTGIDVVGGNISTSNYIHANLTDSGSSVSSYVVNTSSSTPSSLTNITDVSSYHVRYSYSTVTTYYVWAKDAAGNISHSSITAPKLPNTLSVSGKSLTYSGAAQSLASASNAQGTVYYSTSTQLTSSNYSSSGSTTIPTGTNAGTYTVYYYTPGNTSYSATSGSVSTTIAKASCSCSITGTPGLVYPGAPTANLTYSCGGDGDRIIIESSNTGVITVGSVGTTSTPLTGVGIGESSIKVSQEAGTNYNACTSDTKTVGVSRTQYTVSYNMCSGSGGPSSQTKSWGVDMTISSTKPTRTGYTFQGWSTTGCNATSATHQAGGSYTTNASTTMYAVWKASKYYIFKSGSGWQNGFTGISTYSNEAFSANTTMVYKDPYGTTGKKYFAVTNVVDLTNYSYVVYENVYFKHKSCSSGCHNLVVGVYNPSTGAAGKELWLSSVCSRDYENPQVNGGTHRIDVRSLSGNYYVGGYVESTSKYSSSYTLRFYNIYLE